MFEILRDVSAQSIVITKRTEEILESMTCRQDISTGCKNIRYSDRPPDCEYPPVANSIQTTVATQPLSRFNQA